eukprot:scaffold43037_cov28-Tisochrysis_lutea.AAC.5
MWPLPQRLESSLATSLARGKRSGLTPPRELISPRSTCVSNWCVAATEMEHGSATRNPVRVEKQRGTAAGTRRAVSAASITCSAGCSFTTRPRCVSISEATANTCGVCFRNILAHASVAKVPPEWDTRSTTAPSRLRPSSMG